MSLLLQANAEPIPGYVLLERLGAGGYGEVWKALAPGGLTKAVKLVYGRMSEARAARELKALSRIREVRHPFLLSLERFDVVDGQLVIVTELADASLADRYRECREQQLPGIPRQELLEYLSDAAHALDYMSDRFGLQHLDIKPENLLLVGGRVKVADFGLVKDLQETQLTCVGGVTPLYATPEAFAGKASRYSDQYSLAIVYQEMLTGTFPFPGQTTAQLANQHLYGEPLLAPLPPADRAIVARALAKRPEERWASCRQFIEMLRASEGRGSATAATCGKGYAAPPTPVPNDRQGSAAVDARGNCWPAERIAESRSQYVPGLPPPSSSPDLHLADEGMHQAQQKTSATRSDPTQAEADNQTSGDGMRLLSGSTSRDVASQPAVDVEALERFAGPNLADLDLVSQPLAVHPALILGLGGTGGVVLRRLRALLGQQYDGLQRLPAWRWLWLETDARCLVALHQAGQQWLAEETMLLPLRRTSDYRASAAELLAWLSRRWLYNIPRSQRTEGLRPLGRLAWYDHQAQLAARIRHLVQAAVSPEALECTRSTVGAVERVCEPRAYVVASLAGGTCGMLLDVAASLRSVLSELGYPTAAVHLLLPFFTGHQSSANDLRRTNAYAALSELNYLAASSGRPPWDSVYVVDWGQLSGEAEHAQQAAALADYLALELTTPCGPLLQQCRAAAAAHESGPHGLGVRTFAVRRLCTGKYEAAEQQAWSLARRVASTWRDREATGRMSVQSPTLEPDELLARLSQAAEGLLGGPPPACLAQLAADAGSPAAVRERLCQVLGPLPGRPPQLALHTGEMAPNQSRLECTLHTVARRLAAEAGQNIANCVLGHVNGPRVRLGTALRSLDAWQTFLRDARQPIEAELAGYEAVYAGGDQPARSTPATARSGASRGRRNLDIIRPAELARILLRARLVEAAALVYRDLTAQLHALGETLGRLRAGLEQVEQLLAAGPADASNEPACADALAALASDEQMAASLEAEFVATTLMPEGGPLEVMQRPSGPQHVADQLYRLARRTLRQQTESLNMASMLLQRHPQPATLRAVLAHELAQAMPRLAIPAERQRLLVLLPQSPAGNEIEALLRQLAPHKTMVTRGGSGDVVFCLEAGPRHAVAVASALIDYRPDLAAAARRVLSRADVPWRELPLALRPEEQNSPCAAPTASPAKVV